MTDTRISSTESEARAVAEIVQGLTKPFTLMVEGQTGNTPTEILLTPNANGGFTAQGVKDFLDPYRTKPERRTGTAKLTHLQSFIAHTNRFKDENSGLFAIDHRDSPSIQCVLNYHTKGADSPPRFGDHRATYNFPLSDEWKAWREVDGEAIEQRDFAEFLEDRILDVMPLPDFMTADRATGAKNKNPENEADQRLKDLVEKIGGKPCGPAKLMELAKGLRIHDAQVVKEIVNTNTGEGQLKFESEHKDESGSPINIPNLFLIAIPVFQHGELYRIAVRLRYRLRSGRISWSLTMHRPDLIQDSAFSEACERASTETGLPLFYGNPEA